MKNFMVKKIVRTRAALLAAILFIEGAAVSILMPITSEAEVEGNFAVLSLGDSFSSGESVEPFYGTGEYQTGDLPDAHRSVKAWPGQLNVHGKKMNEYKASEANGWDGNWFFAASTGATTWDLTYAKGYGDSSVEPQLEMMNHLKQGTNVEYVTMTIGGNDLGFGDIIMATAAPWDLDGLGTNIRQAVRKLDRSYKDSTGNQCEPMTARLTNIYREIRDYETVNGERPAQNAQILVVGYPRLFDGTKGDALVNKREGELINTAVELFNTKIAEAVVNVGDPRTTFVPVEEVFANHGAYSDDPWIEGLHIIGNQNYSIHPNQKGIEAYRSAVQACIDERERKRAVHYNGFDFEVPEALDRTAVEMDGSWWGGSSGVLMFLRNPYLRTSEDADAAAERAGASLLYSGSVGSGTGLLIRIWLYDNEMSAIVEGMHGQYEGYYTDLRCQFNRGKGMSAAEAAVIEEMFWEVAEDSRIEPEVESAMWDAATSSEEFAHYDVATAMFLLACAQHMILNSTPPTPELRLMEGDWSLYITNVSPLAAVRNSDLSYFNLKAEMTSFDGINGDLSMNLEFDAAVEESAGAAIIEPGKSKLAKESERVLLRDVTIPAHGEEGYIKEIQYGINTISVMYQDNYPAFIRVSFPTTSQVGTEKNYWEDYQIVFPADGDFVLHPVR